MSSFERFAAFIQWCEVSGMESVFSEAFGTSSASAEKSRAVAPIPNANTEAVPRMNFLIIVISRFRKLSDRQCTIQRTGWPQIAFPAAQCVKIWTSGTGSKGGFAQRDAGG